MFRLGLPTLVGAGAGLTILVIACTRLNPAYCDVDTQDCSCDLSTHSCRPTDGGSDGVGMQCTQDGQCNPPHCVQNHCVACTPASAAPDCPMGQICSAQNQCASCEADADCDAAYAGGAACVGGGCVAASQVAFVDCDPGAGTCGTRTGSRAAPYCTLQEGVDASRPQVVMTKRSCSYGSIQIQNRTVTIWGRGAILQISASTDGIGIHGSTSNVTVHDLEVTGAASPNAGNGVLVDTGASARLVHVNVHNLPVQDGVQANRASRLELSRSLVLGAYLWGVEVVDTPRFDLENSYLLGNGNTSVSSGGGARFSGAQTGMSESKFVYNTIARNVGAPGTGVQCETATVMLTNCLVPNDGITFMPPYTCVIAGGTVGPTTPARVPSLIFVNFDQPQSTWTKCQGLHVDPAKPVAMTDVVHRGVFQDQPTVDFDGDPRPMMPTPGADEPIRP